MEKLILKPEIIIKIREDAIIVGHVAAALDVSFFTMQQILNRNDPKLTQASVLKYLRTRLKLTDADLLCEMQPA